VSVAARKAKKERRRQARSDKYWCDYDGSDEWSIENEFCWRCGGDGYIDGGVLAESDPLWYDPEKFYKCNCCLGSGKADDCTYW
jgi:hypothetical protein